MIKDFEVRYETVSGEIASHQHKMRAKENYLNQKLRNNQVKKEIIELRKELGRCTVCDIDYIHPKWWRCGDCRKKIREYLKEYKQRPEVKERQKEYIKEYWQRPEVKKKNKERARLRRNNNTKNKNKN